MPIRTNADADDLLDYAALPQRPTMADRVALHQALSGWCQRDERTHRRRDRQYREFYSDSRKHDGRLTLQWTREHGQRWVFYSNTCDNYVHAPIGPRTCPMDALHTLVLRIDTMKRPTGPTAAQAAGIPLGMTEHPHLRDWMTAPTYDDGGARQTGNIGITYDGLWKISMRDVDTGRFAYYTGADIDELLGTIDRHLSQDQVDWRIDKFAARKKK